MISELWDFHSSWKLAVEWQSITGQAFIWNHYFDIAFIARLVQTVTLFSVLKYNQSTVTFLLMLLQRSSNNALQVHLKIFKPYSVYLASICVNFINFLQESTILHFTELWITYTTCCSKCKQSFYLHFSDISFTAQFRHQWHRFQCWI